MKCAECGSENRPGARFCARCGADLGEAEKSAAVALPVPTGLEGGIALDFDDEVTNPSVPAELMGVAVPGAPPEDNEERGPEPVEEQPSPVPPLTDRFGGDENLIIALPAADEDTSAAVAPAKIEPSDGQALPPLAEGSRLHGRYEIVDVVESTPDYTVYSARDLVRCEKCGFEGNDPNSEFCAECGAAKGDAPCCTIREEADPEDPETEGQFSEGGFRYTVATAEPSEPEAPEPATTPGVRYAWGERTDPGKTRQLNEDYLDARVYAPYQGTTLGVFIVADGVGGQEQGEVASQLATQIIWNELRQSVWEPEMRGDTVLPETMAEALKKAVQAGNEAVFKRRMERSSTMGTTLTMSVLRDNLAVIANVGDSRTYLWGPGGLQRITVDHSVVESLVAAGKITRDQIYTHPQRNLIYRSLGSEPHVEADIFSRELAVGESLVLCSDGLWEMAHDEGIEEVLMREADPQRACDELVKLANMAGGEDNISVIIVQIQARE